MIRSRSSSDSNDEVPLRISHRHRRIHSTPSQSSGSSTRISAVPSNRASTYSKISSDKKNILIKCFESGETIRKSSEIAGININTAKYIICQYKKNNGELLEKKRGGKRNFKLNDDVLKKIEEMVEENPCITLKNISKEILERYNIVLSINTIANGLKRLRITLKKASVQVDRRNNTTTIEQRKNYSLNFSRNAPEARKNIIFIDESGFNLHLRRSCARSRVNTPACVTIPTVRGRNVSLIAAININGIIFKEIISNSNVNSNIFCEFLRNLFVKLEEYDIEASWLILDNASIHKTLEVANLVGETRHTLVFLPPYSPMMNPIEEVFSKIKFCARNILADPTISMHLRDVIDQAASTVNNTDCNNYYTHMYMQLPRAVAGEPL